MIATSEVRARAACAPHHEGNDLLIHRNTASMATLERIKTARRHKLDSRSLIGRSRMNHLIVPDRQVSGEHALIYWNGVSWLIRDMGSRNGTFVDGTRLQPSVPHTLHESSLVAFGNERDVWRVLDLSPPPISELASASAVLTKTAGNGAGAPGILDMRVQFQVSHDEEHVELVISSQEHRYELPSRAHSYLLLVLARLRVEESAELTESEAGWVYLDALGNMLAVDRSVLNTYISRARRQLGRLGIADAARIVERRMGTGKVRIGVNTSNIEFARA